MRVGSTLAISYFASMFAVGCWVLMEFQIHPMTGTGSFTFWAACFGIAMSACMVAPMVAWWFLVPRARWWGIPVSALVTAGTFTLMLTDNVFTTA